MPKPPFTANILDRLPKNKMTLGLIVALAIFLVGGLALVFKITAQKPVEVPLQEVDLPFDPEGPYALLLPRRDGNALILNIKRVSSYDAISYELTYQSEGIDRGVQGKLNTDDKKSEYTQEILFGTCSKGDTFSTAHCVFDKNVENGTLILKIQKNRIVYKMVTTWHFQKSDVALGVITSADNHFTYKTDIAKDELAITGFTIVNDLSGAPKLPAGKQFSGKVYALNVPNAKAIPKGQITIELSENPSADVKIARYIEGSSDWEILDTKVADSNLTASAEGNGIFAVLVGAQVSK